MTTEEFVEAVNAIGYDDRLEVYVSVCGDIFLQTFEEDPIARLRKNSVRWDVIFASHISMPTKILKLMVELAESRAENNRYVILNGSPFLIDGKISTRVFLINEGNLSFATVSLDEMIDFSYTKEELEQLKNTLPKNLQAAVDMLTATVGEAKNKMAKELL